MVRFLCNIDFKEICKFLGSFMEARSAKAQHGRPRLLRVLALAVLFSGAVLYLKSAFSISKAAGKGIQTVADIVQQTSALILSSDVSKSPSSDASKPSNPKEPFDNYDPLYHMMLEATRNKSRDDVACKIPILNPWDRSLWPHFKEYAKLLNKPRLTCHEKLPQLTYLWNNTHIRINESVVPKFSNKKIAKDCNIQFARANGVNVHLLSNPVPLPTGDGFRIPESEQFIVIRCGKNYSKWDYQRVHMRLVVPPAIKKKIESQKKLPKKRMSVLYLSQDGLSHSAARRSWNSTYYYLMNEQGGVPLRGYNAVGRHTFVNIIPWLTGFHLNEFGRYETVYFETLDWPFSWNNFSSNDYITAYMEEGFYQSFNYHKKGWGKPPTNYYFESYFRVVETIGACKATGKTVHQNHLKVLDEFLDLHSHNDFFTYSIVNTLSHDSWEPLLLADLDHVDFFKYHFEKGHFDNTLVIIGSDHGNRFGPIQKTEAGRMEERLPLQLLVFPEWFKKEHKDLYDNFLDNSLNALTTPFDIHATLMEIMTGDIPKVHSQQLKRGMSLFGKIPTSRKCPDAGIPPDSCVCRNLKTLTTNNTAAIAAVTTAVAHINSINSVHPGLCHSWTLDTLLSAQVVAPTDLIKSLKNYFHDYILIFEVNPGKARFDATIRKYQSSKEFKVQGVITRISYYGGTSHCINGTHAAFMKNYCHCTEQKGS